MCIRDRLHTARALVVDHAARPLRRNRAERLFDDPLQRVRLRLHAACQRITAQGPKAHLFQHRRFSRQQPHARVVNQNEIAAPRDNRPLGRVVERYDLDVLPQDVLPDVLFGPVRQRKHPDALAFFELRVVELPKLRPLPLRVPGLRFVAEGKQDVYKRQRISAAFSSLYSNKVSLPIPCISFKY